MVSVSEIRNAYQLEDVVETYPGTIEITNLKEDLGTTGNVLVVRGDKALSQELKHPQTASPKFWLYQNLIDSEAIQSELTQYPSHKLFDGVGFSSLEAIGFHTTRMGREALVVMAYELVPNSRVFEDYNIQVIHADKPMEQGYVEMQAKILRERNDLVPLHQALRGSRALAPVGNAVAQQLNIMGIRPVETYWCLASGSNMYGIGTKLNDHFGSQTIVVEPSENPTISDLDLTSETEVRAFATEMLANYNLDEWNGEISGIVPLHARLINRYLITNWKLTGRTRIDANINVKAEEARELQAKLAQMNPEYNWTSTTALTLVPAIESAKNGNDVLVMSYGKMRDTQTRRLPK